MSNIQIDTSSLLAPISSEIPAGCNIEYEPIYDDIRQARKSDPEYLSLDGWEVSEPRLADWGKVRILCESVLKEHSKDLQIGCWFAEAIAHQYGPVGIETGIRFLSDLLTRFWFQCWPSLHGDGKSFRYGILTRLDRDLSLILNSCSLLSHECSSLVHWRKVLAFEHKICTWPDSREELIEKEGDFSMESFERIAALFSTIEISRQAEQVKMLQKQIESFENYYFSLSQEEPHILFSQMRKSISEIDGFLLRLAQRIIPIDNGIGMIHLALPGDNIEITEQSRELNFNNQSMTRDLAVSQMLSIAHYFRHSEPSSPVPFLMERAAKWANMTLTDWLAEMAIDSNSMRDINSVLRGRSNDE